MRNPVFTALESSVMRALEGTGLSVDEVRNMPVARFREIMDGARRSRGIPEVRLPEGVLSSGDVESILDKALS